MRLKNLVDSHQIAQSPSDNTSADHLSKSKSPAWGFTMMVCSLTLLVVAIHGSFASGVTEVQNAEEVNLRGVLPETVPLGLSSSDFEALGPNWKDWATDLSKLVEDLYIGENITPAQQKEIVNTLKMKLETIERAIQDPRYAMIHDTLNEIHGKLTRRVLLSEAYLSTLAPEDKNMMAQRLDNATTLVDNKIDGLRKYLKKLRNGDNWVEYLNLKDLEQVVKSKKHEEAVIEMLKKTITLINPYDISGEEQKAFVQQPVFTELAGALTGYKNLLEMSFNKNLRDEQIKTLKSIAELLENYEELPLDEYSADLRANLRVLTAKLPDGGTKIWSAIQRNYMNYNFRVIASEKYVSKTGNRNIKECGPVCDCILGARVTGTQITDTNLTIDFKPSDNTARFVFNLSGNSQTNTRGVTDQATVYTKGNHFFNVTRTGEYDGNRFTLDKGNIWVDANNNIYNARVNHRGLLTWLLNLDDVALERARELRGQSEAIAASRLRDRVFPRFNQELEEAFGKANGELDAKVFAPLRELDLYPDALGYQTTEQSLIINARLMGDAELAADRPSAVEPDPEGATVYLHESWMNNAVDRMNLAGRTLTQQELAQELEDKFSKLLHREVKLKRQPPEDNEETRFALAPHDPIRLKIENGIINLYLTTGLKRKDKEDIPTQRITIPLKFDLTTDKILVERGDVSVEPVERPKSVAEQIARAGVMRNKIQEAIQPGEFNRNFIFKSEKRDIPMYVSNLKMINGWLVLSVK